SIEGKVLIVNFAGFLDFSSSFVAEGLERRGATCRIEVIRNPEIERLRSNPTEMRSINIARVMDVEENWKRIVLQIRELIDGEKYVVLPDVFGLSNPSVPQWIMEMLPAEVLFVGTLPPSVSGLRAHIALKKKFEELGGTYLPGDTAVDPVFEGDRLESIRTVNLGAMRLEADSFVLASGNLFGKGVVSLPDKVIEPVFGLDVDYPEDRAEWYDKDFLSPQRYMSFGVTTDASFHPYKDGTPVSNMYVTGAELGGCNPLAEGSGAGVAIMSAFFVSDEINA
ncbi:MAG: anaerobic glycerol-3-phosphate dehydrogenase subunit B, partial [Bacteroidales bacterium]|nr:anaerobic glycerol-3-phosphate dehydrogenase subunit B [Bacteroidales bacterium]